MPENTKFEISTWTIVKTILILLAFYLIFIVRDIVVLLFVVMILTATFSPVVKVWQKHLGRLVSIILLFLLFISLIFAVVYLVIPPLVVQITSLAQNVPNYFHDINFGNFRQYIPSIQSALDTLSANLGSLTSNIFTFTSGIISMIAAIFTIFVLTFYLLLDEKNVKNFISNILPSEHQDQIIAVINKIAVKVGSWFRGQVFLGLIIFVIDYIGLTILNVPYALILAIIAGLLELIPTVGPFIAGLIAAFVALTISPWLALLVICLFSAVQLVENIIIVPKVMQKAVGISPVVILIALLIGGKLMGVVGAILAIPLAASLSVVILEWPTISKLFAKK